MITLIKSERSKTFSVVKTVILQRYQLSEISKWSDIDTLIRRELRQVMLEYLRSEDNDDVANYLVAHEEEVNEILQKKTKSLRESRDTFQSAWSLTHI